MLRPSLLDPSVRLSSHSAPDSIRLCLCSCEYNHGNSHVELPDFFLSSFGDSHLCDASELAHRMLFLTRIRHMNGFVVLRL